MYWTGDSAFYDNLVGLRGVSWVSEESKSFKILKCSYEGFARLYRDRWLLPIIQVVYQIHGEVPERPRLPNKSEGAAIDIILLR